MFISKIRRKIKSGVHAVKKNVVRVVARDPKRKFFWTKYHINCDMIKSRILLDVPILSEECCSIMIGIKKAGYKECFVATDKQNIEKVKQWLLKTDITDAKILDNQSYQYLKVLATAEYVLATDWIPSFFIRREEQKLIYFYKGSGALQDKSQLIHEKTGEVQHSMLQASYLCFRGEEEKKSIVDIFGSYIIRKEAAIMWELQGLEQLTEAIIRDEKEKLEFCDVDENSIRTRRIIVPKTVKKSEDLETIRRFMGENDIVQFSKKQFQNKQTRCFFCEEHEAPLPFLVVDYNYPRTYSEEIRQKLGNVSIAERITRRDKKRKYAELMLEEQPLTDLWVSETGCSIGNTTLSNLEADYKVNDNGTLSIYLKDTEFFMLNQLLLVNKNNVILDVCPIEDTQKNTGVIEVDFLKWWNITEAKGRFLVVAEVTEKETGRKCLVSFTNTDITRKKQEKNEAFFQNASYLTPIFLENQAVLCYQNGSQRLMFLICPPEKVLQEQMQAKLIRIKSGKSTIRIEASLKKEPGITLKNVVFRYRSVLSYEIPLDYKAEEKDGYYYLRIFIDFAKLNLRELYWDLHIVMEQDGKEYNVLIKFPSMFWKCKFYLSNKDYKAGDNHIIFPYYTVADCIAFLYRASSNYDAYGTKLKDMIASGLYIFAKPFFKKRNIWLVFEKFCTMAQDNGYYFFKYCMEELPKEERKHIYYVIDKKSADYNKVKQYGKQVIPFMSIRHCLYILGASLYVGSDAKSHLYAWRSKTSLIRSKMVTRPIFFLQHGVTALKDVSKIFGVTGSSAMTYFTATSQFEQDIIVNYLHYKREHTPITGFARWDVLEDTSNPDEKLILMMPTWRSWLEEVTDEDFLKSDYYIKYSHLLQADELLQILEKYNVKMIFYIHPKFASYQKNFTGAGDRIILVPFGTKPLNEIIKKCNMLITDYSSVCWDVYYQKKPVVFYQFDYDKYNIAHGSFVDMETELFGKRAIEENELLSYVEECIAGKFQLTKKDEENHQYYFEYIDDRNSQRIYQYLLEL